MTVTAKGFAPFAQDVEVRSTVPAKVEADLKIGTEATKVVVEAGGDLLENDPTFHSDLDRNSFARLPLESSSSSVSSLVTLRRPELPRTPMVCSTGWGIMRKIRFPWTASRSPTSRAKSSPTKLPSSSIQSLEVISGAPPAEFGDKTSLVIKVTTRSGQGVTTPHGTAIISYGSFGTVTGGIRPCLWGTEMGKLHRGGRMNTGRFLDPQEFSVIHAKGNLEDVFDRVDYQISDRDTVHLNLGYSRSWFQTPNSYDNLNVGVTGPDGAPVGPTDQRSKIETYNIAPTWTRLINPTLVFTLGGFVRHDGYNYYPAGILLRTLAPFSLRPLNRIER